MAYLGAIGVDNQGDPFLVWSRSIIAYLILPSVIGQYAQHGGYVYVK